MSTIDVVSFSPFLDGQYQFGEASITVGVSFEEACVSNTYDVVYVQVDVDVGWVVSEFEKRNLGWNHFDLVEA
jgi:hypothetical protein